MAHTKGPWRIGKHTNSVISDNSNGLEINGATGEEAVKYYGGNLICESVSIENAKLIAAAPDLLEACLKVTESELGCAPSVEYMDKLKKICEQAIIKATE